MKFLYRKILTQLLLILFFGSCVSRKEIVYMTDVDANKPVFSTSIEPILEPNDMLSIVVAAENPELTIPFNMPQIQSPTYDINKGQSGIKTYLVDHLGFIDYPVLGKIKLGGLQKSDANKVLVDKISDYIKNPSVNLSIANFKVTILGEVAKPGEILVKSERITFLEAIGQAGDLTLFGRRDNILLIREENGKKTYNRINLLNSQFINSDFYYLKQNDLIYVEPNKTKVNGSKIGASTNLILSITSILLTISFFIINKK